MSDLTNEARAIIKQLDAAAGELHRLQTRVEGIVKQAPKNADTARGMLADYRRILDRFISEARSVVE